MNREKLERLARQQITAAHHEAGHAVAAFHIGVEIKKISIIGLGEEANKFEHFPYFSDSEINDLTGGNLPGSPREKLENYAFTSLVGPWAQKKFNPKGYRKGQVEGDYYIAVKLLSKVKNDEEILGYYFKMIDLEARNFVQDKSKWSEIHRLSLVLLDRGKMTSEEVRKTIVG